jgi:hypothetical protein
VRLAKCSRIGDRDTELGIRVADAEVAESGRKAADAAGTDPVRRMSPLCLHWRLPHKVASLG